MRNRYADVVHPHARVARNPGGGIFLGILPRQAGRSRAVGDRERVFVDNAFRERGVRALRNGKRRNAVR